MTTDPFTGRQEQRNRYVRGKLVAKKDMHTAPKWRVRKDGGYVQRQDLCAESRDKLMMVMAMKGDGKACVKFSTPEDNKEGDYIQTDMEYKICLCKIKEKNNLKV